LSSQYLKTNFEDLIKEIDEEKILQTLSQNHPTTPPKLWAEALELIFLTLSTWLPRDVQEFESIEIEKSYKNGKIFIDLIGKNRGTLKPFSDHKGLKTLVDWKTTFQPVDGEKFKNKCVSSWQWKTYGAVVKDAKFFSYRGICRTTFDPLNSGEPRPRVREVLIPIPPDIDKAVEIQYNGIHKQLESLKLLPIWPMNTESCWDFGVPCPELEACKNYTLHDQLIEVGGDLSYSSMMTFLRCPERYRMKEVRKQGFLEDDLESTDSTLVGTLVHEGLAEYYKAVWSIKD